jgi:hypothetical protein
MKEFLTASDIEDLFAGGARQVPVGENVVLTDLAREKAAQLGMALTDRPTAATSAPRGSDRPVPVYRPPVPARNLASAPLSLEPKPKGCMHSHIETGGVAPEVVPSAGPVTGSSSGPVVDRLVEVVRQLDR